MLFVRTTLALACATGALVTALPASTEPLVTLDYGTFQGKSSIAYNNVTVHSFLGVPFAQPPIGDNRFRYAIVPPLPLAGIQNATSFGHSCTQQTQVAGLTGMSVAAQILAGVVASNFVSDTSEDCLTINIQAPANRPSTLLPVVVWVYGGGFEFGDSKGYDGTPIVARSRQAGSPILYVSFNYRLNGFGFLASQEIKDAGVGNIGLNDQRAALRWIQTYISKFGGDPTKVTIWGESAGAISVTLQMVTNGGNNEGLFRGVFAQSGSPSPSATNSILGGQPYYNQIVNAVNCSSSNDTLQCLRTAPYASLVSAINQTPTLFGYKSLSTVWLPRVDGVFLTADPQLLIAQGKYAKVPLVSSDCDDEGTIFSLSSANITTDAEVSEYIQTQYYPNATAAELALLTTLYPQDPTQGSPFNTGTANQLTPQFKRLASFVGDVIFQAPRRYFLSFASNTQPTWSYIYRRTKNTPYLGSFHTTDIGQEMFLNYTGGVDYEMLDYFISFVTTLNPNGPTSKGLPNWPQWSVAQPNMLTFLDRPLGGALGLAITLDNYRQAAIAYVISLSLKYP